MSEKLDKAFEALQTYDWGINPNVIQPIEEAMVASHGDAAARKDLETRLIAVLNTGAPQAAKDAICRALKTIGTAAAVPALAPLLADEKLSHMARYALERIPAPEAGQALRDALPKGSAKLRIGVISSVGVRGESEGVAPLQALLADGDAAVARAAAYALGAISSPQAAAALGSAMPNDATVAAIHDASLACAESLLAKGSKAEAKAIYRKILDGKPRKAMEQAATRGMQTCERE